MKLFDNITTWLQKQRTHYVVALQDDATPQEIFEVNLMFNNEQCHYGRYLAIDEIAYDKLPDNLKRHYKKVIHKSVPSSPSSKYYNIATGSCIVFALLSAYMYDLTSKGEWIVVGFVAGAVSIIIYVRNVNI